MPGLSVLVVVVVWGLLELGGSGRVVRPIGPRAAGEVAPRELGVARDIQSMERDAVHSEAAHAGTGEVGGRLIGEAAVGAGHVRGLVLDELGNRKAGVEVEARDQRGRRLVRATSNGVGGFEFELEPGQYTFGVVPASVPAGYRAPLESVSPRPGEQTRFERQVRRVEAGEDVAVTLHVFAKSIVWGYVREVDGRPVRGASVRLQYAGRSPLGGRAVVDGETDGEGRFELEQGLPGNHRLTVYPPAMEGAGERVPGPDGLRPCPAPLELTLEHGGVYFAGDIVVGGAGPSVIGRIIDQDGAPLQGVLVKAYPWMEERKDWMPPPYMSGQLAWARTEADGRFELAGLPAGRVRVDLAAAWDRPLEERRVATWWKEYVVDLRGMQAGEIHDMGTEFVPEARPYHVKVQFAFEPGVAEAAGVEASKLGALIDVSVRLATPGPELGDLTLEQRFAYYGGGGEDSYDRDSATLDFLLLCPPQPQAYRVFVEPAGKGRGVIERFEFDVQPVEGETEERTVLVRLE